MYCLKCGESLPMKGIVLRQETPEHITGMVECPKCRVLNIIDYTANEPYTFHEEGM